MTTGRSSVANRVARTGQNFTPANVSTVYDRWRSDSGVDTNSTSVWTGSVNGLVLSQATAGLRPSVAASELNGFSALSFDGAGDFIKLASFVHAQPLWVFLVYKQAAGAAGVNDIPLDFDAGNLTMIADTTPRTFLGGGAALIASENIALSTYDSVIGYFNTTGSFIVAHGNYRAVGTVGAGSATVLTLGALSGGTRSFSMKVVELAVGGALTSGDVSQLTSYARTTYGLVG